MIKEIITPLCSVCDTLKKEKRPIFLYGMGNGAEKIHTYLCDHGIKIQGVVASDGFVRGQSFLGYTVMPISVAESLYPELCLVLCFGVEGEKSHFLWDIAKKHRIISPNLPVFGNGACDRDFILDNIEQFERVYSYLADDESREIFLKLLKYNVSGDIEHLVGFNGFKAPERFYDHAKRHIDVGAYDGDTVCEFASHSDRYTDIVAFEPDGATYKKLLQNTVGIRNVICENKAATQRDGNVPFSSGNGRASHIGEGGNEIGCVAIDSYCGFTHINAKGTEVGSIKIDAEGMDEEVIFGAANTIYCCKPSICVALYHRYDDIIKLPLLLKKHYHKYKFYLRKKEYVPAWDVFIYAVNEG